jgi:hypothetical protein
MEGLCLLYCLTYFVAGCKTLFFIALFGPKEYRVCYENVALFLELFATFFQCVTL